MAEAAAAAEAAAVEVEAAEALPRDGDGCEGVSLPWPQSLLFAVVPPHESGAWSIGGLVENRARLRDVPLERRRL